MTCPLPKASVNKDGSAAVEPHCVECLPQFAAVVSALRETANTAMANQNSVPAKASKKRPAFAELSVIVAYLWTNARGSGVTYQKLIEDLSKQLVTLAKTPQEFAARLDALYVRIPEIQSALEAEHPGFALVKDSTSQKTRKDGLPTMLRRLVVVPVKEDRNVRQ